MKSQPDSNRIRHPDKSYPVAVASERAKPLKGSPPDANRRDFIPMKNRNGILSGCDRQTEDKTVDYLAASYSKAKRKMPPHVLAQLEVQHCAHCGVKLVVSPEVFAEFANTAKQIGEQVNVVCDCCFKARDRRPTVVLMTERGCRTHADLAKDMTQHQAEQN